ncbi:MAG: pyrroloquinoline-quinone synthase PqqC [Methylovirgula sp.]|nr:pyrroloquinoline-quinone synthase PqqC [Methylovirgula sp.]
MSEKPLTPDELEAALRNVGAERYHRKHRFHARQYSGKCSYEEMQAWALNRYYYQAIIPIKDATVLTRLTDTEDRRQWRKRIEDHDGLNPGDGGIERWLKLTDSLGFPREYVQSTAGLIPATRFAVDAYVAFCRDKSPVEAVASSLTELFSPTIIGERMSGMLANYDYVSKDALAYFSYRPTQAKRDADWALEYVKTHAKTLEEQRAVIKALEFKCNILWAMLDALWSAYVDHYLPPDAWVPGTIAAPRSRAA